tara:strand:+ start:3687 stop:4133 length:447 start_codon:yes stop_codon:yes gene_type:complete
MTTTFVSVENENVQPRPMNFEVSKRLNLYGTYNETFWERYAPEKNQNKTPASAPEKERLLFDILGSNPLNGAVAEEDAGVYKELDQVLNRNANIQQGDTLRSLPQVGREFINQTISLPQNIPEPVVNSTNTALRQEARSLQTWRTKKR